MDDPVLNLLTQNQPLLEKLWTKAFTGYPEIKTYKKYCRNTGVPPEDDAPMFLVHAKLADFNSVEEATVAVLGKTIQLYGDAEEPGEITLEVAKNTVSSWLNDYFPDIYLSSKNDQYLPSDLGRYHFDKEYREQIEPAFNILKNICTMEKIKTGKTKIIYTKDDQWYLGLFFLAYDQTDMFYFGCVFGGCVTSEEMKKHLLK